MRFNKSFKLLFLVSLFTFANTASASFLVEPYLGYQLGSGDRGTTDFSYNAPTYGARVGYQMLGFMGGIDYSLSSFDLESENTVTNAKSESAFKKNQLGVFAGYDFPILLRAWATYYVSAKLENDVATPTEYSGGGYALGVGFSGLPFVSLNVEYKTFSYDEAQVG
jgi:hypothetical protein